MYINTYRTAGKILNKLQVDHILCYVPGSNASVPNGYFLVGYAGNLGGYLQGKRVWIHGIKGSYIYSLGCVQIAPKYVG